MPTRRTLTTLFIAPALIGLLAAGCGSSAKSVPAGGSTSGAGFVAGAVPSVDGATNLKAAPTLHAGTSPAPAVLTGADLVTGSGTAAAPASTVNIQYVGALYTNGNVFDSSWSRNMPASFPLNQVIPGFAEGIAGMKVGGRRELVIPPALGYRSQAVGSIPPGSTLVFVIDLLGVS